MSTATLPWAGMPNVNCELTRADGKVVGTCTIKVPGREPIILRATADEGMIAQFLTRRGQSSAVAGAQVTNLAHQDVLKKLALAFKKLNIPAQIAQQRRVIDGCFGPTGEQVAAKVRARQQEQVRDRALEQVTAGAAVDLSSRARQLLQRSRAGDKGARAMIGRMVRRAAAGNKRAMRDCKILMAVAKETPAAAAPANAAAGMVDIYAPAYQVSGFGPPMSLHNYFTIGGTGVQAEDFYPGCGNARTCEGTGVGAADLDLIVGADGTQYGKSWDGVRWIWSELRPRRGYRPETSNFGARDALLLGMQRIQQRELAS